MTEPRQDTVEKVAEAIAVALTNGDEDYWASHECHLECARAAINAMSDVREAALERALSLIDASEQGMIAERRAEYGARYNSSQEAAIKVSHYQQRRGAEIMFAALERLSGGGK